MTNQNTRNIIMVAVFALVATSVQIGNAWRQPAVAQAQLQDVKFVTSPIVFGISSGQRLRISVGTRATARFLSIGWTYRISNASNQVLFESERISVPPGEWRFSDVSREDLNIAGEPGTGRAQVMVQVFIDAPRGARSSDFIGSQELFDVDTGETHYSWSYAILPFIEQDPIF